MIIVTSSFSKSSAFKMFFVHTKTSSISAGVSCPVYIASRELLIEPTLKRKSGVFKFLRFEELLRKAPFSRRISVDGRPNRLDQTAFSNSSCVVWTLPKTLRPENIFKHFGNAY